jgi:hypothetical protein
MEIRLKEGKIKTGVSSLRRLEVELRIVVLMTFLAVDDARRVFPVAERAADFARVTVMRIRG